MAESKQTPRQKMIGMMYLVLTALLALNVSKDVLEAFLLVNRSIEKTVSSFGNKNEQLYADFKLAKNVDSVKVGPYWQNALQAQQLSQEMQVYIDSLKTLILMETEGISQSEADTLALENTNKKDDVDAPTRLLIGKKEDASEGKAHELKMKIREYREKMLALLPESKRENFDIGLETDDVKTEEQTLNWEIHNFYHNPMVASITILSKLQNDIRNAEYDVVSSLYSQVTKSDFPIDTIAAKVLAQSNYVLLGDDYQADIFVAAFSKTRNPDVFLGKLNEDGTELLNISDSLTAIDGMGKMTAKATSEGFKSYEGMVRMLTSDNQYKYYPFKSEYIVARPSLVVAPTKMNVFYKGVDNPVDVSVPGVAGENLQVDITPGNTISKTGNGTYSVKLSNSAPPTVNVTVSARMPDGSTRSMGKMEFRAKNLPKPYASILGFSTNQNISRTAPWDGAWINARYPEDFVFAARANVTSFTVLILDRGGDVMPQEVKGKMVPQDIIDRIKKLKRNDRVLFDEIYAVGSDGKKHNLGSILFTIK